MRWIELTTDLEVGGSTAEAGTRLRVARHVARSLVFDNVAEYVGGPHPDADDGDTTDEDKETEVPGAPDDGEAESLSGSAALEDFPFADVDGLSETNGDEILEALEGTDIETIVDLLATDLTELPGVGPAKADRLADALERYDAAR